MARLLLWFMLSLFPMSSTPIGLIGRDSRPVIYVIHENPIAAYYGSTASSYLAQSLHDYQVYANYIDVDLGKVMAKNGFLVNVLIDDIKRIKPSIIFVHSGELGTAIKKHLPNIKIAAFTMEENGTDFLVEDPILRLITILNETGFVYDKIYVMHDRTRQSVSSHALVVTKLLAFGIPKTKIVAIESNNLLQLETNVRALNLKPQSIIINKMFMLTNTESSKAEYLPDIKEIITRVNRKHLDVGFYRTSIGNECLVLEHDYSRIRDYVRRLETNDKARLKPLEVKAMFNVDRLDKLNLKAIYLEGLSEMDDIVK